MAVIGIDPGTAITGYGIIKEGGGSSLNPVAFGVLRTESGIAPEKRLLSIYQQITDIVKTHDIASAAVEKLYFQRNTTTAMSVGQARGVVLLALEQSGISIFEYNPVEIKQAVTGYGRAGKKQIQEMVKVILGLVEIPKPDDAADALAVAICHMHSRKIKQLDV